MQMLQENLDPSISILKMAFLRTFLNSIIDLLILR